MILSFPDEPHRRAFAELLRREREDIWRLCREVYALPHLVVARIDPEQAEWVGRHIGDYGRTHGNNQRSLFQGPRQRQPGP